MCRRVPYNFQCVLCWIKEIQNSIQFILVTIRRWGCQYACKFPSLFLFLKHHMLSVFLLLPLSDEGWRTCRFGHYCQGLSYKWPLCLEDFALAPPSNLFFYQKMLMTGAIHPPTSEARLSHLQLCHLGSLLCHRQERPRPSGRSLAGGWHTSSNNESAHWTESKSNAICPSYFPILFYFNP